MNIDTIKYIKQHPERLFSMLGSRGLLNWVPDELYIKIQFRQAMGYWPDLKNPKTFNEKLQWLKLHDRKPLYTTLVDKYAVRQYIAEKIGEEYLIPLVGGPWNSADEIDFDSLPEQFVLKCNHDSGGVIICKDKSKLDIEAAKKFFDKRLKTNFYYANREWPYKNVKPCIIAEQYLESENEELNDYKFLCFDGNAKLMFITSDRSSSKSEMKLDFYDRQFNHLPIKNGFPNAKAEVLPPKTFEKMLILAEELTQNIPHARIDLYESKKEIYFGEITLYHWSGLCGYDPFEWDEIIGGWLELPLKD